MKVLVTGVKGQLGFDVVKELNKRGVKDILGVDKDEMDLTNEKSVKDITLAYKPDVIIHCAAWTAVDLAEEKSELVYDVNVNGTKYLAECAEALDCKMVYISTDYVFNGQGDTPYTESDKPEPISVYGKTKYLGEAEVQKYVKKYFITRISWVFGINGNNFIKTMLKLGKEKPELNVVCDQIGSPTYTFDLAETLCDMIVTDKYGVYHVTNEGFTSWYDFTRFIFEEANITTPVHPIKTSEYKTKAVRPLNSRMSKDKLVKNGFKKLPSWQSAVQRYLVELGVK